MGRRVGIDLSAETIALADVSQRGGRVQLYGFALVEGAGEVALVAGDLRNARRKYGLSRRAEVVAWPDDPRVDAVRQAGFSVERVITPGEALARVAQMHHNGHPLGLTTAVVSLHVSSGALAVVHEGTLLHEARLTLPTGTGAVSSELLRRYAFLAELSERLRGSFADVRRSHDTSASEILTCGSLPELRSFTMPLADEFDIDVETLDALDDIEIKIRNLSPEQLRDRVAGLRVAIVAGRPSHLQPKRARRVARIAVPAGLAAAALLFLTIYGGSSLRPPARPQPAAAPGGAAGSPGHAATASGVAARRQGSPDVATREAPRRGATADQAPVARAAVPTTPARVEPQRGADASSDRAAGPVRIAGARVGTEAPERAASGQPTRAPAVSPAPVDSPEVRTREPLLRVSPSAVSPAPPPRQAAPPPRVASAPAPPPAAPRASAPATAAAQPPQRAASAPAPTPRQAAPTSAPSKETVARQASGSPVAVPAPVAPTREALRVEAPRREPPTATERPEAERNASDRTASVLPASFTVASILWSPDRQLAFIGGRIVAVGDIVDGARVVEIRQDSVLVRDAQGRLRRAVLAGPLDPGS